MVGELPLVAGWLQVRCGGPLRTQSVSSGEDDPRRVGSVLAEAIVGDGEHGGPLRLIRPNDAVVELVEQAMQYKDTVGYIRIILNHPPPRTSFRANL